MLEPSSTGIGSSKTQLAALVGAVQSVIWIVAWMAGKPVPLELSVHLTTLILCVVAAYGRRAAGRLKVEAPREPHQARPEPALSMPTSAER